MGILYRYLVDHWMTIHGLAVMLGLAAYVTTSHTLHLRRHPSAAIVWVVFLVMLPYAALATRFGSALQINKQAFAPPRPAHSAPDSRAHFSVGRAPARPITFLRKNSSEIHNPMKNGHFRKCNHLRINEFYFVLDNRIFLG